MNSSRPSEARLRQALLALEQQIGHALASARVSGMEWRGWSRSAAQIAEEVAGEALGSDRARALRLSQVAALLRGALRSSPQEALHLLSRAAHDARSSALPQG